MIGYLLAKIPKLLFSIGYISMDLIGLFYISLKKSLLLISPHKRQIYWVLFKRQLFNVGLKSIYINAIIAIFLSWLVMSKTYSFLPEGLKFAEYYAQFFVLVVLREIGPLFSGLILIARSSNAITFEIGHLKLHKQFEIMKAQGMDPILVFLLPVLHAFPLSLLFMMLTFACVCLISSYFFIIVLYQPDLLFRSFVNLIIKQISFLEVIILGLKILIGGTLIGLLCIYFATKVEHKFTDISRAISSATSSQIFVFVALSVGLSFLGYQ